MIIAGYDTEIKNSDDLHLFAWNYADYMNGELKQNELTELLIYFRKENAERYCQEHNKDLAETVALYGYREIPF